MSDGDLLDEATRLADEARRLGVAVTPVPILRALVDRVRDAEKLARMRDSEAESAREERDTAWGLLDAVRAWAVAPAPTHDSRQTATWWRAQADVLAILDRP